jgi:hypothetical protein
MSNCFVNILVKKTAGRGIFTFALTERAFTNQYGNDEWRQ